MRGAHLWSRETIAVGYCSETFFQNYAHKNKNVSLPSTHVRHLCDASRVCATTVIHKQTAGEITQGGSEVADVCSLQYCKESVTPTLKILDRGYRSQSCIQPPARPWSHVTTPRLPVPLSHTCFINTKYTTFLILLS